MAPPDIDELQGKLRDHRFPVGRTIVHAYEAWLGNDAMNAPGDKRALGPMWSVIAGFRGMGTTIEELLHLAGSSPDDGVMFGELATTHVGDLVVEKEYTVECHILDVSRKSGSRTGVFDLLSFEVRICENEDDVLATVVSSFILPRSTA